MCVFRNVSQGLCKNKYRTGGVALAIDVLADPGGVEVEIKLVAAAVVRRPAPGWRDTVANAPRRMKVRPPLLLEERAHQPLLFGHSGAPPEGARFRSFPAQIAGLARI